ncbi:hypothetical protein KDC22_14440 [Paenibacillus tritici]|uniref:hypothetical protein n=1 Tax=Paenibacillus tritici TaxID=1873425 RepID=UPI001BA5127E|nr:hypothetical protein [Paenibacillus tritici]QUL57565.1 hypothetical protein KDC22_14440 [Paenibacillus tritici]
MKKKEETAGEGQSEGVKPGEGSMPEIKDDDEGSGAPEKNDSQKEVINFRGVVLKGTDSQKIGPHTLFIGSKIVNFVDGKADVQDDIAAELEDMGYIE